MNQQLATQNDFTKAREIGMASSRGSKVAPQNLAEVVRFAEVMSNGGIALPKHLRENPGACMAVTLQALEWEMNPFAVAQKSYEVNGMIAYEAQLIAAVVNTRSGIDSRLKYSFCGEGENLVCTVVGKIDGEELEYISPRKGDIKPQNSPLWKTDPQQQLGYYSARAWARRHTPEVLLGVYDRDEAAEFQGPDNARDVTPAIPLSKRLEQANASETGEGFNQDYVEAETAKIRDINEEQEPAADAQHAAEASEDEDLPSEPSDATESEPEDDEPSFPGDLPLEDETESSPVDEYVDRLSSMGKAKDVHALTNEFMDTISKLSKEDQDRAETARVKRLKAIAEESIGG